MKDERPGLGEGLVALERMSPAIRQKYDTEMKKMFEKTISPLQRTGMIAVVIVLAIQMGFFGYAVVRFDMLPLLARLGFVAGILFSGAFMAVMISALKKGSYNLRTYPNAVTGITWVFLVIFITLIMLLSGKVEPLKGIQMVVNTTVFFIMGVVFLLKNTVEQAELKTREKLLDIECRLADIAEKLNTK